MRGALRVGSSMKTERAETLAASQTTGLFSTDRLSLSHVQLIMSFLPQHKVSSITHG